MSRSGFSGGDRMMRHLEEVQKRIERATAVRVGFLENSTYPDGTPTAYIAAIQEFGATVNVEAHTQTIYRSINSDGSFKQSGRFVKSAKSNYATDHAVGDYTITIPARPFFRRMLDAKMGQWPDQLAKVLRAADYDGQVALQRMGEKIKGDLQGSVRDLADPPLAPSTIAAKGFDKPLIDTGHLMNSVDYQVTGAGE